MVWTEQSQSRRCPLCSQKIEEYLIHHIRSKYDYQKYYLSPVRGTSPLPLQPSARRGGRRRDGDRAWGRRARMEAEEREVMDAVERAVEKRRWVYQHGLYAKVSHILYFRFVRRVIEQVLSMSHPTRTRDTDHTPPLHSSIPRKTS